MQTHTGGISQKLGEEDRLLQQETALRAYHMLGDLTYLADSVTDLRDQVRDRAEKLPKRDAAAMTAFADDLEALHATLVVTDDGGLMSGREELRERLGNLFGEIVSYDGRPSDSQLERVDGLAAELAARRAELEAMIDLIGELNRTLARRELPPLERLTHEAWQARQEGAGGSGDLAARASWGLLLGL